VDALLGTNVKGVIWTVQKALPLMGSGGSIILSASIVASKGFGDWSHQGSCPLFCAYLGV